MLQAWLGAVVVAMSLVQMGDALGDENLTDIELTDEEELELWLAADGENVEELTRAYSMSWFNASLDICRDVEKVPKDVVGTQND